MVAKQIKTKNIFNHEGLYFDLYNYLVSWLLSQKVKSPKNLLTRIRHCSPMSKQHCVFVYASGAECWLASFLDFLTLC